MEQHLRPRTRRRARILWAGLGTLAVAAGCESMRAVGPLSPTGTDASAKTTSATGSVKKPGKYWLRASQYVFYSDVPLEANDPLFKELDGLPEQVQQELKLPPGSQMIQVFLFEDEDQYKAFMRDRFPWLPQRRAYFIAEQKRPGADDLQVFTWMGEHIRTDLRHELTHATLHGVLKGVPLWLDEGLAGYFEQPTALGGVNPGHLKAVKDGPFQPDLARLEKFGQVRQMDQPEYREAWAWAHYLIRDPKARPVLLDYMSRLREEAEPGPLLPRLQQVIGDPNHALAEHLAHTTVPPATPKVRTVSGP